MSELRWFRCEHGRWWRARRCLCVSDDQFRAANKEEVR